MFRSIWNWEKTRDRIRSLRGRLGFSDQPYLEFLKIRLHLDDGRAYDTLRNIHLSELEPMIYYLLYMYSKAEEDPEAGRLISFKDFYGGAQYYGAFHDRVIERLRRHFGERPDLLLGSAELLGGSRFDIGDLGIKLYALPRIPIFIVLWIGSEDIPSSLNILFDESATRYFIGEEASVLGSLTAIRLVEASKLIDGRR